MSIPPGDRRRVPGESGTDRTKWGLPEFGADVRAVIEAGKPEHVILFGNSLGEPVAIEAALLMPGRVTPSSRISRPKTLTISTAER